MVVPFSISSLCTVHSVLGVTSKKRACDLDPEDTDKERPDSNNLHLPL